MFACSVQRDGRCRGGGTCWHCSVRGVLASLGSVPVSFFSFSTWRLWMSVGRRPAAAGASPARPLSRGTPACRAAHPLRARRYGGGPAAGAARGAAPRGVAATPRRSRGGGGGEPRRRGRMAGALGCWQRVGAAQGDRGGGVGWGRCFLRTAPFGGAGGGEERAGWWTRRAAAVDGASLTPSSLPPSGVVFCIAWTTDVGPCPFIFIPSLCAAPHVGPMRHMWVKAGDGSGGVAAANAAAPPEASWACGWGPPWPLAWHPPSALSAFGPWKVGALPLG